MDGLEFLQSAKPASIQPVYVLHGEEEFLKRQALVLLRNQILGDGDDSFGLSSYTGDHATFAAVHDELQTLPFLGTRRLVIIEAADPFVSEHRGSLEKYVAKPAASGVLVLDVKSWPANTRLAKLIDAKATIVCRPMPAYKVPDWCVQWAKKTHGKQLTQSAARLLVDLVGPDMGVLDQELAKLAVYAGKSDRINDDAVDRLVGSSRTETTWKIFNAIGAADSAEALAILDRLFTQGEDPMRLLGAFSMQLRRLAQAARITALGLPMGIALERAGFPPFARKDGEQQLRHLGRNRADSLYEWLLETDLGLKGSSQLPPRLLLERLVVKLVRKPV